jgi:hypothetical protein
MEDNVTSKQQILLMLTIHIYRVVLGRPYRMTVAPSARYPAPQPSIAEEKGSQVTLQTRTYTS